MTKSFRGIDGVLNNLISSPVQKGSRLSEESPDIKTRHRAPSSAEHQQAARPEQTGGARRGRPTGRTAKTNCPREKATFRISADLLTDYRDWSWESRCSLSALVEKAMAEYRRHR